MTMRLTAQISEAVASPSGSLNPRPIYSCWTRIRRQPSQLIIRVPTVCPKSTVKTVEPQTSSVDGPFTQADWDSFTGGFTSQYTEHAFFLNSSDIEGEIPVDLSGSLLRNGPALYEIGGKKIPQPFDGDGMVASVCFPGNGKPPFVANRFVRTEAFIAEQQAGKMLYRGAFSVGNPAGGWLYNPFDLSIKKVANTGVVRWAGRLLALYERDLPYELSLPDLRTLGPTTLESAIDGSYFAAHYRIETDRRDGSRRLIGFQSAEAGRDNEVTVWELDENGKQLHRTVARFPDATFAFLHDFAITENYYVFLENPVRMDFSKLLTKYMFGRACIAECLKYDASRSTKIHVIPRPGQGASEKDARVFLAPSFFSFHHANAYETADGRLIVDTVALHEGMDFSANLEMGSGYYDNDVGRGTLTRISVNLETNAVAEERLMARACEFPSVAPKVVGRRHRHLFATAARTPGPREWGPPQVVVKVTVPEVDVGGNGSAVSQMIFDPGQGRWAGEPVFVPRGEELEGKEDDGWVLVMVFDSGVRRTDLVILNAADMQCVATVKLPFFLPSGLHGSWTQEYLGPPTDVPYAAKSYDIRNGALKYE